MNDLCVTFINNIINNWKIIRVSFNRFFSRFNSIKFIRYSSLTKLSRTVHIFIIGFKLTDFFSVYTERTIFMIAMQTQSTFCFCFVNTKRDNILSKVIPKPLWNCSIKCYSKATMFLLTFRPTFRPIFYYISQNQQAIFK